MFKILWIIFSIFWIFMYLNLWNKYLTEADALYSSASYSWAIEKYNQAITILEYKQKLKIPSYLGVAYFSRGDTYDKMWNKESALKDYLSSEQNGYESEVLYNNIGILYYDSGDALSATSYYNKALKIAPNAPTTYYNKGFLYQWEKNYNEALKNYNKAIELGYDDHIIYYHRILIYNDLKKEKELKKDLETLKNLDPELYSKLNIK